MKLASGMRQLSGPPPDAAKQIIWLIYRHVFASKSYRQICRLYEFVETLAPSRDKFTTEDTEDHRGKKQHRNS